MYNLVAKPRDTSRSAKKLRSEGIIPASIYGRNLKESVHVQIPLTDVKRLLNTFSKGSTLTVEVDDHKYNVLFKEITRQSITQQIEQIEFQHIVADEAVNSVMKVILANREKNQHLVQQHIEEIPYNALPRHFIQEIIIDLDTIKVGSSVKVGDLDIAQNENIKLMIPEDTAIVSVSELKRVVLQEETDAEEGTEE